jgi:hypothetical protein
MAEDERKFTQADVDRIVTERLARDREVREARNGAKDNGNDAVLAKIAELQNELRAEKEKGKAESIKTIRDRIASEVKLPAGMSSFLQGEDEVAIRASAEAMLKSIGPGPSVGGVTNPPAGNAGKRQYTKGELASMKPEDINKDWENINAQLIAGTVK